MEKIKTLPPLLNQSCLRLNGMALSTYLANDLYYFNRICQIIIAALGKDWVRNNFPLYKEKELEFNRLNKRLYETKVWYDAIEDKKFEKKEADVIIKRFYTA
jgi:hypothetical protein